MTTEEERMRKTLNTEYKCFTVEEFKSIRKDLEILEILKNNLYEEKGTGRFKGCNTINCSLGNQHSGIDYTKVKEWLENGK